MQAVNVLKKNQDIDGTVNNLFSIIVKLKDRGIEMKNQCKNVYQHDLTEKLNELTLKLVLKQKELETAKKQSKELEIQVKDQKKVIDEKINELNNKYSEEKQRQNMVVAVQNELNNSREKTKLDNEQQSARIMELESELAKKNDVIMDLEESEKALVGRCKSLENCEAELSEKLKVMMAINSHVGDKDHEVVAVNTSRNS